ncbi:MAG: molybdenum cofactor synthesis domain protein [Firmicutes bacterium]|nr:molybdenum cofactor synthesis domain protein [Bacillota bacterium]
MRTVRLEDAENCVCCHDITKIVPGEFKGRAFKKGHIITKADIFELRKLGKEHIFIWEEVDGKVHENDAAVRIANAVKGKGLGCSAPAEGKIMLTAQYDGMCMINEEVLLQVNMVKDVMVATRSNLKLVKKGDTVAGLRAIPLTIDEALLQQVEALCKDVEMIAVKPMQALKVGVVTTGNEVYSGLIQDKFGPFLRVKLAEYGCELMEQQFLPDDSSKIAQAIRDMADKGAQLILTTGGMSVDPDDVTPKGIRESGTTIVSYGTPVLPGAMLMVGYLGEIPVLGLPGGVMYSKVSALDILLPFIITDEKITKEQIAKFGLGGLCLQCPVCHYPICPFGTGA